MPAPLPQVAGTLEVDALSAPVRVVRDRWGVPHIYAESQADLFFAQGFVQAQDRLFQMDLWKKSVQGRLSQVLGSNFIERDAMTRRMQYRGDLETEWASYGPDTREIAAAFVRGINAWVGIARGRLPEEFILAGWPPEFWRPEDLLNRTDGFLASDSAADEVLRARLVAARGPRVADRLLPLESHESTVVPSGLDVAVINYVLGQALRRVGTPPFFTSLSAPVRASLFPHDQPAGSNAWVVDSRRSATGAPLLANDPHLRLEHPSRRYLVHLVAPGWNVVGATSPWLPGVAIGHNDRVAWGLTSFRADVQDLFIEKVNPTSPHQVEERGRWTDTRLVHDVIPVKGGTAFEFEHEFTRRGAVVAIDRQRSLAFTLRWTGTEPGTASGLSVLALDRARSWPDFRAALARWKMPPVDAVYADVEGNIGHQVAALVPIRRSWNGALPAPGWTGTFDWIGWRGLDDLPWALKPRTGQVAAASGLARANRLVELLAGEGRLDIEDFKRWQHDTVAWNAQRLVPLLAGVRAARSDVEAARQVLLAWDKRVAADSSAAALYVLWERALLRKLAGRRLDPALVGDYLNRLDDVAEVLVPASGGRQAAALEALTSAVDEWLATSDQNGTRAPWGRLHTLTFAHPLGVTEAGRRRFNVGPFALGGYGATLRATHASGTAVTSGASFRQIIDLADWDRSMATNAPGQSGSPGSPHFADLARLWAASEYFPVAFSEGAVQAAAESTLTLTPRRGVMTSRN